LELEIIFYYLRFETSLFVASYDSQDAVKVFDSASTREAYRIGDTESNSSFFRCHETDISVA
jgi:hypothetical protein